MTRDRIDPSRRSFLMPGSRRVTAEGQPALLKAEVGPSCLAQTGVDCRLCGEHCEAGAIRFPPRLGGAAVPVIDAARCTGCGDCLPLCPPGALRLA
jgi:ferredoxin-type protein NapF